MNIQEMHNTFRTLGQQMGIQLVRGILPESIDVYINDVIIEKVQTEIMAGVRTAMQDSVNTQAQSMSPINLFRSLYRSARYSIDTSSTGSTYKVSYYNSENGYHIINIPTVDSSITVDTSEYKISPMLFLGFSVEYSNTRRGNPVGCRLIGSDVLETTLRDYCNGASKDSPIVCLSSIPVVESNIEQTDVTSTEQLEVFINTKDTDIKYLNIKYLKTPNVVKFDIDLDNCINCDLPAYTHFEIVEKAVYKFYQSVGATSGSSQSGQRRDS